MSAISDAHVDRIIEIAATVAECADEARFPGPLMRDMTDLFASRSSVYYTMSDELGDKPIWNGFGYNVSPEPVKDYEAHYRSFDPCFAGLKRRAHAGSPLVVSTDQVIASERSYVRSGYYRDFLRPQHIHSSIIFAVGDQRGLLGLFGFHRAPGKPHYAPEEHLKARLFAAQMAGALRAKRQATDIARLRKRVADLESSDLACEHRLDEYGITPREREVVHHVSQGLTTTQIADRLGISEKTVEQHLDHVYRKTGTHNRTALVYRLSR